MALINQLERYIFRRCLFLIVMTLSGALAIVWTIQALSRVDLVTDSGQSVLTFFRLATLLLPAVVPVVMPFVVAIAVASTMSSMNNDSELVVINASGAPRRTVNRPVLILAALASVVAFAFNNGIEPNSRQAVRQMIASANKDLLSSVIREGAFRKITDNLFIQVSEKNTDGSLSGMLVADSRDPKLDLIYYAKQGHFTEVEDTSVLIMRDGEIHRKNLESNDISVIQFTSYAFDLSEFTSTSSQVRLLPKDQHLSYLMNPDANDPIYTKSPLLYRAEIHKRFSEWLYPFVFALLALAVAGDARSHREARINPIVSTLAVVAIVRWAGFIVIGQASRNEGYIPFAYAVPICAALVACLFLWSNKSLELPVSWTEWILRRVQSVQSALNRLRIRWSGFRPKQTGDLPQ